MERRSSNKRNNPQHTRITIRGTKEQARRAAQQACRDIWKELRDPKKVPQRPTTLQSVPGWKRPAERPSLHYSYYYQDDDASSVNTFLDWDATSSSSTITTSKLHAVPEVAPYRKHKNNTQKQNDACDEAWLCGVTGQAFATYEAAEAYENRRIQQVVESLTSRTNNKRTTPWNNTANTTTTAASLNPKTNESHNNNNHNHPHRAGDSEQPPPQIPTEDSSSHHDDNEPTFPIPKDLPGHNTSTDNNNNTILMTPKHRKPTRLTAADDNTHHDEAALLLSRTVKDTAVLADEALVSVCRKACEQHTLLLRPSHRRAEQALAWLAHDKAYYDHLDAVAAARQVRPTDRFRSENTDSVWGKVQNKLLDAYQIMKDGAQKTGLTQKDQYDKRMLESTSTSKKNNNNNNNSSAAPVMTSHSHQTVYVNVMVRNSVVVVRKELERLAEKRWEKTDQTSRFARFRDFAHLNIVKLAGIAMASDLTPRRIAVQMSNDLYRLLTPRLKRRGVAIETEIEYRNGPYFVLAVNITSIDWWKLIKATYKDVSLRQARWQREQQEQGLDSGDGEGESTSWWACRIKNVQRLRDMSLNDWIEQTLFWMYFWHWMAYLPICYLAYRSWLLGNSIRQFILSSVTDEIFYYAEKKGMEMEIRIHKASQQAAFMLSALRELRAGGRALAKRKQESQENKKGDTLGPLLGPLIKEDAGPAVVPDGFEAPDHLEFIGLELDLPVGFRRLRWALLSNQSDFVTQALYDAEAKYDHIRLGEWDKHGEAIGATTTAVDPDEFIGATKEGSYLMPRSAFVAANMCYETHYIVTYNDYCFCLKKRARNPDAPFGKTFIAWTQYVVTNLGNNSCKLVCSVEAEFPNGEPMVSRQIRSGMRAGTGELFVLTGETISKYADEVP